MTAATPEGTQAYVAARSTGDVVREHFRDVDGLLISSIGLGTYLGHHDEETDELYQRAIIRAVGQGCNVIDTAINYRCQRSEKSIGQALKELAKKGIGPEQVVVATKGGFIPFDSAPPGDVQQYLEESFFKTRLLEPSDVVGGCHAMTPRFLENQLDRSLENLGVEAIDIYYLHNPETQLDEVPRQEFFGRLRTAFEFLEKAAAKGKISFYGVATWNAFRQSTQADDYLSMEETVKLAREVGGESHRFRFVQLPYSLAMTEALAGQNQSVGQDEMSPLMAADELGIKVMSSASIAQGRLTHGLPDWLGKLLKGLDSDVQRSIQFARSTPGLTTALVGMKQDEHVDENLGVAKIPPAPVEDFLKLFEVDSR
jgi:aryl-alcohol dehydrogenase-like predicted oxidoreductase